MRRMRLRSKAAKAMNSRRSMPAKRRNIRTRKNTRGGAKIIATQDLVVDGMRIKLAFKTMRSITMRVKTASEPVYVSAPAGTPKQVIEQFVRSRKNWIIERQRQQEDSPMARANQASLQEIAQWRAIVEGLVPGLVDRWSAVMGVIPGKLAYRNMKSRWGSCQPSTGRICINVRLALYPPRCLEYVVVHELAHLLVSGHGPQFYAVLDRYLPDWREAKKLLDR